MSKDIADSETRSGLLMCGLVTMVTMVGVALVGLAPSALFFLGLVIGGLCASSARRWREIGADFGMVSEPTPTSRSGPWWEWPLKPSRSIDCAIHIIERPGGPKKLVFTFKPGTPMAEVERVRRSTEEQLRGAARPQGPPEAEGSAGAPPPPQPPPLEPRFIPGVGPCP